VVYLAFWKVESKFELFRLMGEGEYIKNNLSSSFFLHRLWRGNIFVSFSRGLSIHYKGYIYIYWFLFHSLLAFFFYRSVFGVLASLNSVQ
jgi:hypothetical protein